MVSEKQGKNGIVFYTLQDKNLSVTVTNFGARMISVWMPDAKGQISDVLRGPKTEEELLTNGQYYNAIIGRCCNRIAGARFELNGKEVRLTANENGDMLHGGTGLHNSMWQSRIVGDSVEMTLLVPDGADGFPGNLSIKAVFELRDKKLGITLTAVSDQDTVVNLTNHNYWNLGGEMTEQTICLFADRYLQLDENLIPLEEAMVAGTDFDYRTPHKLRGMIDNHFYGEKATLSADNGRKIAMSCDRRGFQCYTEPKGDGGFYAICFEPQFEPNAVNRQKLSDVLLKKGDTYKQKIEYHFEW